MRMSSPHLLDLEKADERTEPVAGGRDGDVRDAGRAEHPGDLGPFGRGCAREAFAHAVVAGVDLELLAGLWVDEPDGSDVRELVLTRIADLDSDDLVTGSEAKQ